MNDYLELPIDLDDLNENESYGLWIEMNDSKPVQLNNVQSAHCHDGWWNIYHEWLGRSTCVLIEQDKVNYFRLITQGA